jgi:hypothetical protein
VSRQSLKAFNIYKPLIIAFKVEYSEVETNCLRFGQTKEMMKGFAEFSIQWKGSWENEFAF